MSATTAAAFTSLLPRRGSRPSGIAGRPARRARGRAGGGRPSGAAGGGAGGRGPRRTPLAHPGHEGVAAALVGALPLRGIAVDGGPQVGGVRQTAALVLDLEEQRAVVGVHDGL